MGVYDPFNQGYMHDWRLEEAVREGVRRALADLIPLLKREAPAVPVRGERDEDEEFGRRNLYTEEEVLRIVEEAVAREREEIIKALEDRIVHLVAENERLRRQLAELEGRG